MMKKIWRIITSIITGVSILATTVLCVFAFTDKTVYFAQSYLSGNGKNDGVVSDSIYVPYAKAESDFTVYVSPSGDDSALGMGKENAVKTIKRAQVLVRNYFSTGGSGNAMIILCDGEYYLDKPIELTNEDVGNGSLYIRAENNNKATLSGAKRVDNSTVTEVNDSKLGRVWKIPCAEKINQLYLGESYGIRARFPDAGEELRAMTTDQVYKDILIDGDAISEFEEEDFDGAIMTINTMWAESYLRIDSVKTAKVNVKVSGVNTERTLGRVRIKGEDSRVFAREGMRINETSRCAFHFENSKAFLNAPGEWYYEQSESIVYYLPRENETLENTIIRIPYSEVLVEASGKLDKKISNVTFEGVNFAYTANTYVDGKIGGQANRNDNNFTQRFTGGANDARPIAAIEFENAENIKFSGNVFKCLGGGALDFVSGVKNITVEKNMFRGIGGNGVLVGPTATGMYTEDGDGNKTWIVPYGDSREYNVNIYTENNYLTDIGWQEYGACAVIYTYSVDSKINYNTINNVRYTGISSGWGWDTTATSYDFYKGIEIGYNRITGVMNYLADGGAIYTIGVQQGARIHDNYIGENYSSVYTYPDDVGDSSGKYYACCGIYLDNTSGGAVGDGTGFLVENNYVAKDTLDKQYQTVNARKTPVEDENGNKLFYYTINDVSESEKERVYKNSGVREDGFKLIPSESILWGVKTESEVATVYGNNLGKKSENSLILRDKDGKKVSLAADDIIEWTDNHIKFKSSAYKSGEIYLVGKDGKSSNGITATLNVDKEYCMSGQFDKWGGLSGIVRDLQTQKLNVHKSKVKASSTLGAFSAANVLDGNTGSLWASDAANDNAPWIEITLGGKKVDKIILGARTDGGGDEESRKNLTVSVTIKKSADVYETIVVKQVTEADNYFANGILEIDLAGTEAEGKFIYTVKIEKTQSTAADHFLCIADVMFIPPKS